MNSHHDSRKSAEVRLSCGRAICSDIRAPRCLPEQITFDISPSALLPTLRLEFPARRCVSASAGRDVNILKIEMSSRPAPFRIAQATRSSRSRRGALMTCTLQMHQKNHNVAGRLQFTSNQPDRRRSVNSFISPFRRHLPENAGSILPACIGGRLIKLIVSIEGQNKKAISNSHVRPSVSHSFIIPLSFYRF
ncbi:hypothetical protein EVAR_100574_1 [Eumeta japonica]|uniref:Uncharacterized protein n=1 Tax=Eumeta variegata TaxID=151549 RepID=A0A4C1YEX6_EUMVA|nr:hypothetical protein EVAR_100574_1 [Eumeta japonica]